MTINKPFQYSIVKFNHDHVRREPVNVAIILLSNNENKLYFKSILDEDYDLINSSREKRLLITGMLGKLKKYINELNYDFKKLIDIYENSERIIEFTELRGMLSTDYSIALESLFERYIGVGNFAIRNTFYLKHALSVYEPIQLNSGLINQEKFFQVLTAVINSSAFFKNVHYTLPTWQVKPNTLTR